MREETAKKWMQRIEEAEASGRNEREWCERKGISYASLRMYKMRLEEAGYLGARYRYADGEPYPQPVLTYHAEQPPYQVHFVLSVRGGMSAEARYEWIRHTMGREPNCDEVYVFQGTDRREQYQFRRTKVGYAVTRLYGSQRLPFPKVRMQEGRITCSQAYLQRVWEQGNG